MSKITRLLFLSCLSILFCLWPVRAYSLAEPASQDNLEIRSARSDIVGGLLKIEVSFSQDVSSFQKSELVYRLYNNQGRPSGYRNKSFDPNSPKSSLIFFFTKNELTDSSAIEYYLRLVDEKGERLKSASARLDLTPMQKFSQAQEQIKKLEDDKQELENKKKEYEETIRTLLAQQKIGQLQLDSVKMVTDDKIIMVFTTDKPGRIRARISGPSNFNKLFESSGFQKRHVVVFDGLGQSTTYDMEVFPLDHLSNNQEMTAQKLDSMREPRLKITTLKRIERPNYAITQKRTTENGIEFEVTLSEQDGYVEIDYAPIDKTTRTVGVSKSISAIKQDDDGVPVGELKTAGVHSYSLSSLQSDTSYLISVRAINRYGRSFFNPATSNNSITATYTTLPTPPEFDFADDVSLEITPLGITMKWKAKSKPTEAKVIALFSDKGEYAGPATTLDPEITATIGAYRLPGIISAAISKKETPVLKAWMKNDRGIEKWRTFKVSFLPLNKQAIQASELPEPQRTEVANLIGEMLKDKDKKVNWTRLAKIGLGILALF